MKKTLLTLLLTLVLSGMAWADKESSLVFDPAYLQVGPGNAEFGYGGLPKISVGLSAKLPVVEYFVALAHDENPADVSARMISRHLVATVDPEQALNDIPTADSPELYADIISLRKQLALGENPVWVAETISTGDQRWARIIVFPVTIEADGNCYFNESMTITVRNRQVASEDLLSSIDDVESDAMSPASVLQAPLDPTTRYLIVTSPSLYESAMELARYRSSLGINTVVELIADILVTYQGRDDAEKLRERLKVFQANGGSYVLLAGDETQLPIRYAYPYPTSSTPDIAQLQICDLYFADLTGEWDYDNDGVWGENYHDAADLTPEIIVGRLPFNSPGEMFNYVDKLVDYETNPGNGDFEYLEKAFMFSSDQMRDDNQHAAIASSYPASFDVDTALGIELASGSDPNPHNLTAAELIPSLSNGYGIVNVIAHGDHQAFGVRTSEYNLWPKSYMMTAEGAEGHGDLNALEPNHKISFYYSLACDNGAFDRDQPPFNYPQLNLVQCLLGLKDAGAVGFVANSRWGWVGSSYLIQQAYFDSLFASSQSNAACALYSVKPVFYYYRDQVFGLNYFGDPLLKVYTTSPRPISLNIDNQGTNPFVYVSSNSTSVDGCTIVVSKADSILQRCITGSDGRVTITCDLEENQEYVVTALKSGYATGRATFTMTIVTDVDDDIDILPRHFGLSQNYPNPFNPATTIRFELAARATIKLMVYNVLGQVVTVLLDETLPAGEHCAVWDGTDDHGNRAASGIYLYRLETVDFVDVKKMVLLR